MKTELIISWVAQLAAAVILLQTLFFKFTGAPESVYIFSTLGAEPWGRLGSGVVELVAAGLLLWPRFAAFGALLGLGVMGGAIISHLTKLGIVVQDDGGTLFILAVVTAACCVAVVYLRQATLWALWAKFAGR
jgi:hypothetical protein